MNHTRVPWSLEYQLLRTVVPGTATKIRSLVGTDRQSPWQRLYTTICSSKTKGSNDIRPAINGTLLRQRIRRVYEGKVDDCRPEKCPWSATECIHILVVFVYRLFYNPIRWLTATL